MTPQPRIAQAPQAAPSPENPLAGFVALESMLRRAAGVDELKATICNAARGALPYRQAFVLQRDLRGWRVTAVSSVSNVDAHAPLMRAVSKAADNLQDHAQLIDLRGLLADAGMDQAAYPFAHGLLAPLRGRDFEPFAAVLFARERPWREQDDAMADAIAEAAAHAWTALQPQRGALSKRSRRKLFVATALALLLLAALPVPLTALAPAEVVARTPVVVAAPLDGVVATLPLAPNTRVEAGDVVLTFVDTKIRNDYEIAEKARAVAAAKLHRVVQSSFGAPKDSHDIAIARAELALAEAEAARAKELLERSVVRAQKPGILVYSAPEDWIGKPVSTGERMMDIVDPARAELRIDLAIADVIALNAGADVRFFPDGAPLDSRDAVLERVGYRATPLGEGLMAYRNYAVFRAGAGETLRIGSRGSAKLYAGVVPLALYLLRRPFAAIRQQVGL